MLLRLVFLLASSRVSKTRSRKTPSQRFSDWQRNVIFDIGVREFLVNGPLEQVDLQKACSVPFGNPDSSYACSSDCSSLGHGRGGNLAHGASSAVVKEQR